MTEFERFARALALTETNDNEVAWGDPKGHFWPSDPRTPGLKVEDQGRDFMAAGRWQMHPAWYAEWADPAVEVSWSWDEAFKAALRRFYEAYEKPFVPWFRRAMIFHLGATAVARGDWDRKYEYRFQGFWDSLAEENKA